MNHRSLSTCFSSAFRTRKDKPAITFLRDGRVETRISYLELDNTANRMANAFAGRGVQKGNRGILFFQKSLIFVIAHLALQKLGAVSVPLNPGFKKAEMTYLMENARAKLILLPPEKVSLIDQIAPDLDRWVVHPNKPQDILDICPTLPEAFTPPEIKADDPALIVYTSGTTGKPKGAILTQKNLLADARNIIDVWEIRETDVLCHALPFFHVHGLCFALQTALLAGAHVVLMDRFSPQSTLKALCNQHGPDRCTLFMAVPAMYTKLMEFIGNRNVDFQHVRLWTSGSAPLLARDFDRIHRIFGKQPVEREGMSETGMNFSNPLRGRRKPGSIGVPLPELEVRIVNPETGIDVEPGHNGEIWLRGSAVTPGYWQKPEETARSFEKGWFKTGDLGNCDADGYYYLTDRTKHIIISGGENISPKEVEGVINQMGGVLESSVVGIVDKKWGEKVVAAVVKKPDSAITANDIQLHCKTRLHDWKCPKKIIFVKKLPRNTMGKVLKEAVKKFF